MIICSKCGKEVEFRPGESEFCPECGTQLHPEEASAPEQKGPVDFAALLSSVLPADETQPEVPAAAVTDCPQLKVEYNRNLYFVSGSQGTIKLRVTPQSGEVRGILLFMIVEQGAKREQKTIPVQEILTVGHPIQLPIPYRPENVSGMLTFSFRLGCKKLNTVEYYQFELDFPVYDPKQEIAHNDTINISQVINASDAADVVYRDNLGHALQSLADKNAPSAHSLISRMNAPAEFIPVTLMRSRWTPEQSLVKGQLYVTDRLVIQWNDFRILLLSKNNVKFGRSAEHADLVVRAGGKTLTSRDYPNNTVSRFQAEVLYCEDTVKIFDHSKYGTYINGRRPDSAGIPIADHSLVEFGDIVWQMELQHCYAKANHCICQSCAGKQIKSLTFTRQDSEKEYYLLIWECCELGRVNPLLADWTVFVRNGSFFIRTPEQEFIALYPGQVIESNHQKLCINYSK